MLQRPARKISKWAKFKEVALITSIVVKSAVKQTLREKLPLPKSLDEIFIRYLIYPEMTNVLRPTLTSAPHNSVNMEEEKGCDDIINTASYNYVGLAKLDSTCVEFLRRIIQETPGCGFAVSPTIDSALTYHLNELLEQEIMKFTGKEAAIITASGYMANTATLREIASKDTIGKGE